MSFSETIFLFFLALIIFGPKKLPEIARQVGKWMNEFRRASNEFKSQIEQEIAHLEVENKQTILPPSEPLLGTTSRSINTINDESSPAEPAATLAASTEEPPVGTTESAPAESAAAPDPATEAIPRSEEAASAEAVTSPSSQETHA